MSVAGTWTPTLLVADLLSGPGSNLPSSYQSPSGQLTIVVYGTAGSADPWRIDVRKADVTWDSHLTLWVRRVGDGLGLGQVAGGLAYQAVTGSDSAFFSGTGDCSNLTLQVKLAGTSVQVPPGTYSSNLTFTVVPLP
jgi:hypothetical protein